MYFQLFYVQYKVRLWKVVVIQSLHHHICSWKPWASVAFDRPQTEAEVVREYDDLGLAARSLEVEAAMEAACNLI